MIDLGNSNDANSQPSKRLLTQRIVKDSGVKQQMLVAISEERPENYQNVTFGYWFKHIQLGLSSNTKKLNHKVNIRNLN